MKYNRYSLLVGLGHCCADINQGALPALLPFLVRDKGIDYASAAGLIFAANSVSSFIQPLFGYLGDKVFWPWLMGLGILLAGGGLVLVGFLDSYWAIFIAASLSGIGIALFHPEGGRMANLAAGENKGAGIALFAVGGNVGFALGALMASTALTAFGLKGTGVFLIPALGMAIVMFLSRKALTRISAESQHRRTDRKPGENEDDWASFCKVSACVTGRSIIFYGLTAFIPLYFASVLKLSENSAGATLTLFSVSTIAATLLGGQAADRFGFARVIKSSFVFLFPLILVFALIDHLYLAIFLLIPMALAVNIPQSAMIGLGQKCLPHHIGTSSGVMLGLAVSVGGMVAPGLGWIGDRYGLFMTMMALAAFAALTCCLSFLISDRSN